MPRTTVENYSELLNLLVARQSKLAELSNITWKVMRKLVTLAMNNSS